ncbi:MAG TPA: hypothetical protein VFO60_00090, partial [Candidatus Dormibacteraeota bacterium]|nr:hypothetical protein [Candidatus Dormibacteraeota bacterium]
MSSLRDRINDAVNQHTDVLLLGTAVVVLFLVVVIFLWSRRAARLQRKVEELESSRDALKQLLRRPETVTIGGRRRHEPAPSSAGEPRDAERAPANGRLAVTPSAPPVTAADPAAMAVTRLETTGATPAQPGPALAAAAASDANGASEQAAPAIPETWRAAEQDVTPPAAAWAASATPSRDEAPNPAF